MPTNAQEILKSFELPKGQKHLKNDLSAPFWTHRRQCWENSILDGKWRPNSEIPLVLESRQVEISNKHTWRKFGAREGLQNQLQKGAMHREISAVHRVKFAHFGQKTLFVA